MKSPGDLRDLGGGPGLERAAHLVQQMQQLRPCGSAYVRLGPFSQVQTVAPLAA